MMTSLFEGFITNDIGWWEISIKIKSSSPHEGTVSVLLHELYRNLWR